MSLPVMLLPLESESLPGFLMRVSQRNVVPNSIQLLRSFGLRPRVAYGDDDLVTMAKQLSIETEQLSRITTSLVSHNPLLRVKFQRKGQMICPACLGEGGYLRQAWLHEGPGLAKRLGSWHGMLYREFSSSAYDFVREALAQHVAANFDGHLNQRLSTIDPKYVEEKCWLSPAEAGRYIGIGAELLRAAVLSGEIKGKLSVAGANRFVSLHRDEAEKIRRNRLAYLTATEARNRLGASKGLFERLLQAGALPRYSKQQRPPLVSAEFREKDIVALITRLSAYLQVRDAPVEQQLGLHDLSARHGLTPDQISSVLQQILDGRLRPVGHKTDQPGVAGLRYDRHQIEAVLVDSVEEAREPTLLITDLVRMQGWKHEVILGWISAGLLNTAVEQRGRQIMTVIPVSSLLNFLSRYLVLADAAQRVGSKSNWMLRGLMPAGISGVGAAALPGGGQRGVLLEIDAVLRAAQWNKRTAERAFTGAA